MGDVRFREPLERLKRCTDVAAELHAMRDEDAVQALAAASREQAPYLANVLATHLLNRLRRKNAILDHLAEAVLVIDADCRIQFANPATEHLLAAATEEILGKDFHDLVHRRLADGRHLHDEGCPLLAALRREASITADDAVLRAGALEVPVEFTVAPVHRNHDVEGHVVVMRDVTVRRRAERELQESAERYRRLSEGAFDAIVIHENGIIQEANSMVRTLFGYEPHEVVGRFVLDFVAPESRAKAAEVMAKGIEEPYEAMVVRKDGTHFPAEILGKSVPYQGGLARVVNVRDATRRRQAERAWRESERRFRTLTQATSQIIWAANAQGVPLDIGTWGRFTGQRIDQSDGWGWLGAVHPDDRVEVSADWAKALAEGSEFRSSFRVRRADGEYRQCISQGLPVHDENGNILEWVGLISDITEEAEQETQLRQTRQHYRQLLDNAPAPILVHVKGRFVYANRAAADLLGATDPQALVGLDVLSLVHPDDREMVARRVQESVQTGARQPPLVEKVVGLDGKLRHLEVTGIPATFDGQRGVQVALRDVTEARLLDEERRKFREELESRVRDRTAALSAANRELESFTYSVSHDLRAPLRGVTFFAQLLDEDHREELSAEGQELLRRLRSDARRMQEIIEDLLSLSRSARGDLHRERFDLAELARSVAQDLTRQAPDRRVEWRFKEPMIVEADQGLLRVVLENLLGNALKFTRGRELARIEVGERERADGREFFVRDNGAGFDPSQAARLFRPFERLHSTSQFEGTGIGLATVARIIARHGGSMRAEGSPGEGATFSFTLPSD